MAKQAVLDRSGLRIRLRGETIPLEGCIVTGNGEEHRYRLEPNKWCKVDEIVFEALKRKFEEIKEVAVPDWDTDTHQRQPRLEASQQSYIMEFEEK